MDALFFVIPPFLLCMGAITLHLDKSRTRRFSEDRSQSVDSITWRLFGHGWYSEQSEDGSGNRIYEVEYRDLYGNGWHAWCKTALFGGVYLSEEEMVTVASGSREGITAEEKVLILEAEVRRLKSDKRN